MATAAEDFDELFESMGLVGTAADVLSGILQRVTVAEREAATVARIAAESGKTAAQVRTALGAASAAAAAQERALAAEQKAAARAAEEEAEALAKLVTARSAAADAANRARKSADEAAMAGNLEAMDRRSAAVEAQAARQKAAEKEIADLQKKNLGEHQQTADAYWGRQKQIADATEMATKPQAKLGGALTQLASSSTQAHGAVGTLQSVLGMLGPEGQAAAIAIGAVVLVVTALAAAVAGLISMAVSATQEKDALRTMIGADTLDMLEELSTTLPYTTDQLGKWAKALKIAGYEGNRLKGAIQAIGASAAIMKDGGAAAESLFERLSVLAETGEKVQINTRFGKMLLAAGVSVADVAKALGVTVEKLQTMKLSAEEASEAIQKALVAKGAGALAAMAMTLDTIRQKVSEGIGDAFEDLGDLVHPFMKEVQLLAAEFYKGGVGANLIATIVRGVLEPAFKIATSAIRTLHIGILQLVIYGLQAYIALRPLGQWLERIGVVSFLTSEGMRVLKAAGAMLLGVLVAVGAVMALFALPFIIAGAAILAVGFAIQYLVGLVGGAIANLDNLKAAAARAGTAIITGLGNAIQAGAAWVVGLVQALSAQIIGAITGPLQIKSPSRVAERLGGYFTEGLGVGIDDGSEDVEDAATGAGDAAVGGLGNGLRKGKAGKGGGRGKIADTINIYFTGAPADFPSFSEQAEAWLEKLDAEGPDPEPAT